MGTREQRQSFQNVAAQMRRVSKESGTAAYATRELTSEMKKAGAPSVAQDLSRTAQATENLGRAGKDTDRSMGDMTRTVSKTRRETEKAGGSFRKFGGEMLGLRQAAMVALIPAIGLLTQGIGALGSGIGSLLPQLTSLGALAAPVGVGMLGIGTAMLTVKLATNNLSKAMAGNKNALKALTPEGRQFLRTLKEYRPVMDQMRRSAQRGLFPGLDIALRQLQGAVPTVRSMLRGAGASLGQAAAGAARRVTGTGFLRDLEMLGGQGQTLIRRGVTALLNVGDALRHVLVAAMPFTDWLSRTVVQWTRSADAAARLGRQTGRMGDWFLRARDRLAGLFDVVRNLYGVFRGLTRAITPLGDQMWGSIDRVTRRWNDFINSTRGQGDLRRYFASVREPLRQMAGLFGDLARGLGHLAAGSGFANAVAMLRQAVPALVAGLGAMAQTFGPAVVGALTQVLRMFGNLAQHGGAFSTVLGMLTNLVSGFNWMLEHIPALGTLISGALTVSLIGRAAGAVGGLAGKWMGVKAAATQAAEAEVAAGTAAAGGGAGGMGATLGALRGRGVRGNLRALRANAGALSTAGAIAAMGAGQALGGPGGSALTGAGTGAALGAAVGSVVPGIGTAVGAVVGGLGGGLLGVMGGLSAQRQQQLQQANAQTQQFLGAGPSAAAIRGRIGGLQGQLRDAQRGFRLDRQGFAVQVNTNPRAVQAQLSALHAALPVQVRIERQQAAQEARAAGQRLAFQFGEAFNVYSRRFGPERGMNLTRRGVVQQMQRMGREGRLALAQNVITWAREQARQNPKLRGAVGDLVRGIVGQFKSLGQNVAVVNGQILTGSQAQWAKISAAIQGPVEQAQEKVTSGFTAMQREALNALKLMGFSPRQARQILSATQAGGAAAGAAANAVNIGAAATTGLQRIGAAQGRRQHTRGGRIAGQGLMDTVPVAPGNFAAPGELIVNRHTERRVNSMMAAFGTSLGREVAGETRPHFAALGQRVGAAEHGVSANAQRAGLASQVSLSGVHPDVLKAASVVESRFPGLIITSGTGGGHARGSYHYRGMAVDMGGAPGLMNRAAAWIGTNLGGQLLEGIHNPNLSIKNGRRVSPGFWGPTVWGEHANHIHMALGAFQAGAAAAAAGMGGGGMMQAVRLRQRRTGLGGVPGALGDRALGRTRAALQAAINSRIGAGGGGAIVGGMGGTPTANQRLGRAMMLAAGYGAGQWPALNALWQRESGWNANAVNRSSGAAGIPQALGHGQVFRLGDARAQIAWGLNYIRGRYGTPSSAWAHEQQFGWYGMGGRVPDWGGWHARGGRRRFTRPTLIGVGEAGAEDVEVRPAGGGGRGEVHLHFHPGSIVVHGGDAQKVADEIVQRVEAAVRRMRLEPEGAMA